MAMAPGKSFRKGLTILELVEMFPTEESAREWFESIIWADGRTCPHCGSRETVECAGQPPMPYWCRDCCKHFSVRKGTVLEGSPLPFRKWALAIHLHMTSLKGVSSMKLHRDIGVTQKTAWFMLQRIREAFRRDDDDEPPMSGPVESDEAHIGGLERNKHESRKLNAGRETVGKTAAVGVRDRETNGVTAKVIPDTKARTLQGFVESHSEPQAQVYTDEGSAYIGIARAHESINHSAGEYVSGRAHTDGMESFWAVLKRAHKGVCHKFSVKHLQRYVNDFAGRHNVRSLDTIAQVEHIVAGMAGKRLTYGALKANNGLPSGARA